MTIKSIGVIVGRFQVASLHAGHLFLMNEVQRKNDSLLIVITTNGGQATNRNPLDLKTREQMLRTAFPDAIIRTIQDTASDLVWSNTLDTIITEATQDASVTLYGSRDSFIPHYQGRFRTELIPEIASISGTRTRSGIKEQRIDDPKFRQGMICAILNRFPTSYQTIDLVVYRPETGEVLLGKKTNDENWRFIGGFVDPKDDSLETAVRRECYEETGGVEISTPQYAGSVRINDCRYRGTTDGVLTAVFTATYVFGAPKASDDLAELTWVKCDDVDHVLIDAHKPIWNLVKQRIQNGE